MAIEKEVLDQLLAGRNPQELFAKHGLIDELKKALSERMLAAELDHHLESEAATAGGNRRNGTSQKTMLTGSSKVTLDIPRDRSGTFDPKLIARYQRRFPDFDDKIISMYARGMTVREIRGHLEELYGIDVSPDIVPQRHEFAAPMMRRAAGFHADQARWERREEGKQIAAANFPGNDNLAPIIHRVDEEHMLGQIEANRGDRRQIDW